jgi:hypothetical protein
MRSFLITAAAVTFCLAVGETTHAKPPPYKGPVFNFNFPKYGYGSYYGKNWCYPNHGCRWAYRCYLADYASYVYWDPIECRWYIWYPAFGRYIPYTQYLMLLTPSMATPPTDLPAPAATQLAPATTQPVQ